MPRFTVEPLPELPHARQLKAGFPRLKFDAQLEAEFRHANLDDNVRHIRVNLCLALAITLAFTAVESLVLPAELNRIAAPIHMLVIAPMILIALAASFSKRRQRFYPPCAFAAGTVLGLAVVAIHLTATRGGVYLLFPSLLLTTVFIYFMGGLIFYYALAANVFVVLGYLFAGAALKLPGVEFGYDAMIIVAVNIFCSSVVYMHEKTGRLRFLEAGILRELVARDGLTGIQNRRMFDQHIQRVWHQGVRESKRLAMLLVDIDCFKDYNDRYGHQAGDECLRAVAVSLARCARRPLDFVARYGGEEFAIVLYEASRDYVAEVLAGIQRCIAELNIPHEASRVASRLTVSVGAAYVLPGASRTHNGVVQLADEALYSAKAQGRNRVVVLEAEYNELRTGRFELRRG